MEEYTDMYNEGESLDTRNVVGWVANAVPVPVLAE